MQDFKNGDGRAQIFRAGRLWEWNICGAAVAGGGTGVLMLVLTGIVLSGNPTPKNALFAAGVALFVVATIICVLPGNLMATYPYAILVESGNGLELHAPLKKVFVPIADVKDVRIAAAGFIVRLKRRRRLLKSFIIPVYFGDQAGTLADLIRQEIQQVST
jgi:hypothetical protein